MPLSQWTCDTCGDTINNAGNGILVFQRNQSLAAGSFMIVHKSTDPDHRACDPGRQSSWIDLPDLLGADGLTYLLSFLSLGPIKGQQSPGVTDLDAFVDLVRRVQVPFYEEARQRFGEQSVNDRLDDANEVFPYLPEMLERVASGTI